MSIIKRIFLFFLILQSFFSMAQQYNFKKFTPKDGLASSIVNNIFQDTKGYIWFCTQGGGVSRFDGKSFKNFNKEDGLIDNDVTYLTEDNVGNIWIATSLGVSKFDGISFVNYGEKEGLPKGVVYCINIDEKNRVWFAIEDAGITMLDGKTIKYFLTDDGLPSNRAFTISQDRSKNYWFGLKKGIAKYDGTKITSYDKLPMMQDKTFFSSLADSKGNIWFGGISGCGVLLYDGNNFLPLELPEEVKNDFIGSIAEDKKGNIWFATDHGLLKYDARLPKGKQFHLFSEKDGLSSNLILSVFSDYENNIWVGTQAGGVNMLNSEAIVNYSEKDGLPNKAIAVLIQESPDTYIVGTPGFGITLLNTKTNTAIPVTDSKEVQQSDIHTASFDHQKLLWIGAQEGIFVLKKEGDSYKLLRSIKEINKTALIAVVKIIQDKNDVYWIASFGRGVIKIKGDEITHFSKENGFVSDNILTLFIDSKSNVWIGTKDEGIVKYDGEKFTRYTSKEGFVDKTIWSITEDKKGNIYFGTNENGVCVYDGKVFRNYTITDGLCSNYITSVTYDSLNDFVWVGTENGLNRLKLKNDFKIESLRYYGEQQGFTGTEINQNGLLSDDKGLLWICTVNGIGRYNSKFDFPNTTPPKLHLSGIRLAYQNVDWKNYSKSVDSVTKLPRNLVLSYKNNSLMFDFQAFTTDNVNYTFILEGQDENWSPLSPKTEAIFNNITPGKSYIFKVKAVNSNGIWTEDEISFNFRIEPPWWQSWWFYTLSIFFVIAGIYSFIRYRTYHHEIEKRVLEGEVKKRTHELKKSSERLSVAYKDLTDSINYAKKIQDAILPLEAEIRNSLPQSFVLFKPRDVVSGDFYWFNKRGDKIFFAAVDCTGHGVPGAFMSMIGSSLLNEIISKKVAHDAASILTKLHHGVRKSLKQDREVYESKDGMDIALTVVDLTNKTLQYAGAKRPLYVFRKGGFQEIKADKQSIGGLEMEHDYQFKNHIFELEEGDTFYLFSDGFVDQFGSINGKKYSSKRLKETLHELQIHPMEEQGLKLDSIMEAWKSNVEQVDDILLIGIRF